MKIVMTLNNEFINDTRVYKEAKSLSEEGHDVVIIARKKADLPSRETVEGFSVKRLSCGFDRLSRMRIVQWLKLVFIEVVIKMIIQTVRERPNIIHAHDIDGLLPAYIARIITGALLIYDSHEYWSERKSKFNRSDNVRKLVQKLEEFLIRRVSAVITVSPSIVSALQNKYGIDKPVLVRNIQEYQKCEPSDLLRRILGIPKETLIAIYAGNITEGRGLVPLVLAASHLQKTCIVVMGNGPLKFGLIRLVEECRLSDRVLFLDAVPRQQVHRYLCSADVGLECTEDIDLSYRYSLGNKLFHYMMAGLPVLVSEQPDKRDLVENYGIGASCNVEDPKSIASALERLLNDAEAYEGCRRNALEAARDRLNWEREKEALLHLYERFS